jgi:hypothetical protein
LRDRSARRSRSPLARALHTDIPARHSGTTAAVRNNSRRARWPARQRKPSQVSELLASCKTLAKERDSGWSSAQIAGRLQPIGKIAAA